MRTAGSISISTSMPPKGKYNCIVVGIDKGVSSTKKTPFVEPTFTTGEDDFSDQIYVTEKTVGRLSLFARKVCGMPDEYELPDEDKEAATALAKYIMANAINKKCIVTVEEIEEMFMPTTGPDAGRNITKKRRRVAFRGYERFVENKDIVENNEELPLTDDDLPF